MSDTFGWNWLYKVTEEDLKKKEDVLTLLIHFLLIQAGYTCIGLGDDKSLTGNECACETLPDCWNATNNYSVRYIKNDHLYILRGVPIDDDIVYNLLRVDTLEVTNVALKVNDTVEVIRGTLETLFKNKASQLIEKIRLELLNKGPNKEATIQTTASAGTSTNTQQRQTGTSPSPPHPSPLQVPRPPAAFPEPIWADPERDPLRVGRTDLDPFAGGGGGMLFNPFAGPRGVGPDPGLGIPGGLPRGSVPPGARFDPFGPTVPHPRPRHPPPDDHSFDSWYG